MALLFLRSRWQGHLFLMEIWYNEMSLNGGFWIKGVRSLLKIEDIRELIRLIDQSSITEFKYEHEELKITIKKGTGEQEAKGSQGKGTISLLSAADKNQPAEHVPDQGEGAGPKDQEPEEDAKLHTIVSPMVGTFYRAPSPEAEPYVKEGDYVTEDTVVCIVEAMKLMNEIQAEVKGVIVKILAENGQLVEYGQPLFLVRVD